MPTRNGLHRVALECSLHAAYIRVAHPSRRTTMRSFLAACLGLIVIALAAAAILDADVQKSAATAFSTSEVRL
jgi:hypothetical protein